MTYSNARRRVVSSAKLDPTRPGKLLPSEHQSQSAFFDLVRLKYPRCELIYAVPNGGHRHKLTAVKLKREGVKAGIWDITVDVPAGDCHGLKMEVKSGNNKLTKEQKKMEAAYIKAGYYCVIVRDAEEAMRCLDGYFYYCTSEQRLAANI